MKRESATFDKEPRSFFFEQAFLSMKDYIVICFLTLILEFCRKILLVPILAEWKLSVWGDRTLLSVYVLLEVIAVCVVAFIPVMLGLYIVFTVGVKKNIQRLKELTGKHHKINHLQNDLYKKGMRGKVNNRLMEFLTLGLLLVTIFTSDIIIYILLFYYSTFKRARLYFQVKKERKSVLKERDMFV